MCFKLVRDWLGLDGEPTSLLNHRVRRLSVFQPTDRDLSVAADKFAQWETGTPVRFILQCRVALGKCFKTHQASPHFVKPPPGCQSVNSLPGIEFEDEEYIVYNGDAAYAVHLIAYTHGGPSSDTPLSQANYASPSDRVANISDPPSTRHHVLSGTDTVISSGVSHDSLPPYSTLPGTPGLVPDYSPPLDVSGTLRPPAIHTQLRRSASRVLSGDNLASSPLEMVSDDGGLPLRQDTGPIDPAAHLSADLGPLHSSPQSSGHSNRSQRSIQFAPREVSLIRSSISTSEPDSSR